MDSSTVEGDVLSTALCPKAAAEHLEVLRKYIKVKWMEAGTGLVSTALAKIPENWQFFTVQYPDEEQIGRELLGPGVAVQIAEIQVRGSH